MTSAHRSRLLQIARGRWRLGQTSAARDATARLRSSYGTAPSAAGAYVLEGTMLLEEATGPDELRQARTVFGRVPALFDRTRYPDGRWRRDARMGQGRISMLLGELNVAAGEFLSAIEDETSAPGVAEARIQFATVLLYQGRWLEGAEILQDVVNRAAEGGRIVRRAKHD